MTSRLIVHATAIAVDGTAVLLRGASGSGKSDLALRLVFGQWGRLGITAVQLISDDQVVIALRDGQLLASAPAAIAGKIEVRGLGIVPMDHTDDVPVRLLVDLVPPEQVPRMPDGNETATLAEMTVPSIRLHAFTASAPLKVLLALRQFCL